ncbi:MAG: O-antigen ligase family protein [Candidatus Omnitrophota bacterium]
MALIEKRAAVTALDYILKWCVLCTIFCLPFSKSIVEIAIAVALIAMAAKKITLKEGFLPDVPLITPLLIFIALSALSFFNTEFLALSLRGFVTKIAKWAFLYYVVVEAIDTKEKLKDLLMFSLLSFCIIVFDGFLQYYVLHVDVLHYYPSFKYLGPHFPMPFIGFPTASFPYPNDLGSWLLIYLLPILSVATFGLISWAGRIRWAALWIPGFFLFVLTKARSAWLGFIAALFFVMALNIRRALAVLIIAVIVISVAGAINATMPSDSEHRTSLVGDIFSLASIGDRVVMWRNGWKIFKEHPIVGSGVNTFFMNYMRVRDDEYKNKKGSYAHNCFLQMAADIGALGLGGFLLVLGTLFISSVRGIMKIRNGFYSALAGGLLAGIFAFLVHAFFDTNLYSLNLAALFWAACGIETAIIRIAAHE